MHRFICSRLVRQDHVREDVNRSGDQRSPIKRTFAEAKQTMADYEDASGGNVYAEDTFLEADEDETYDQPQYRSKADYSASDSKVRYDEPIDDRLKQPAVNQAVRSADSFLNESLPDYSQRDDSMWYGGVVTGGVRKEQQRTRRRRSRELAENEVLVKSNEDETKRKPETMRSISEDTPTRTIKQPVTRRTLSHPEKDSQVMLLIVYTKPLELHSEFLKILYFFFPSCLDYETNERTTENSKSETIGRHHGTNET